MRYILVLLVSVFIILSASCASSTPESQASEAPSAVGTTESSGIGCDKRNCPQFYKHLEAKNCTPIYDQNNCCPIAFNCGDVSPQKDQCVFDGHVYSPGSDVRSTNPCQRCRCNKNSKNETEVICTHIDCPSVFHRPSNDPTCRRYYTHGECCSREVCGEEAAKLDAKPNCTYNDVTYLDGQHFYPDSCTECTCNEDWSGDTANVRSCRKIKCHIELKAYELSIGCEPVYMEDRCCPLYYICPNEVESIVSPSKPAICPLPKNEGTGNQTVDSFYFNKDTNLCEFFHFKGEGGNANRFPTYGRCMHQCVDGYNTCQLDSVTGVCLAHFTKFFYNKHTGKCEPFLYGGCGGNANNFRTLEECNAQCQQPEEPMKCKFNGMEFNKGDQLIFRAKNPKPCVSIKCVGPPHLTFTHRTCPEPPHGDCIPKYNPNQCCPEYECKPKPKKICLAKRFFQHEFALGCTAEYDIEDTEEECPIRFNCPRQAPLQESHCHVLGKTYTDGQAIEDSPKCRQCYCNTEEDPTVECLGTPCDNVGNLNTNDYQLCYYSFNNSDSCCPSARCEQKSELKSCKYKNLVFYDGQKIFPDEDPCMVCHCNSNWGGIGGPTCKKMDCNLELQRERILRQCIPVYLQSSCCPVNWICPDTNRLPQGADLKNQCYFNKTGYDVGTDLNYPHRSNCIDCKCVAPPRFTCIQEVCPPPPVPRKGYKCEALVEPGACCASFDCDVPVRDPCREMECGPDEKCVRLVDDCPVKPCHDFPKCVPKNGKPCDNVNCTENEVCVVHTFPCDTGVNCPVRAACLPRDPCKSSGLQCGNSRVCKNLIPGCRLSPCPLVATCVDQDPCIDFCKLDQKCITEPQPCDKPECPLKPICISKNCPTPACSRDSIFRPYGQGEGNCPYCEKISTDSDQEVQ